MDREPHNFSVGDEVDTRDKKTGIIQQIGEHGTDPDGKPWTLPDRIQVKITSPLEDWESILRWYWPRELEHK